MRILLDTSPLLNGNSGRGVGTYTKELLAALRTQTEGQSVDIVASHELPKGKRLRHSDYDIVHYPYFDLFFRTLPLPGKTPIVVTIHDVIPLIFPKHFVPGVKGRLRFSWQKWAVGKAKAVITDSVVSQQDIVEHLGFSEHAVHVVPLAASPDLQPQSEYYESKYVRELGLPEKYILYVGDINYNKNLPTLLLALTQIPDVHLVVVSQTFSNTAIPEGQQLAQIIRENNLEERIHVISIPKDQPDVLASVMQRSRCLVQPSLYEGFGLPVLEAMQCGSVVVSTNGGSLPEVAGKAAIVVDPTIAGLQEGITEALRLRGEEREERIKLGLRWAKQFSWNTTARETLAVYENVLQSQI